MEFVWNCFWNVAGRTNSLYTPDIVTFKQADVFYLVGVGGVATWRSFSNNKSGRDCDLSDAILRRHQSAAINKLRSSRRCFASMRCCGHDASLLLGGQLQRTVRSTGIPQPGVLDCARGHHRHQLRGQTHFVPHQGWGRFVVRTQLREPSWTGHAQRWRDAR